MMWLLRCELLRASCVRCSGGLLPPSPPAEKATCCQDQTGKASAGDGAGYGCSLWGERTRCYIRKKVNPGEPGIENVTLAACDGARNAACRTPTIECVQDGDQNCHGVSGRLTMRYSAEGGTSHVRHGTAGVRGAARRRSSNVAAGGAGERHCWHFPRVNAEKIRQRIRPSAQ
jgi:hypothetical protein